MGSYAKERAAARITELPGRSLDLVGFWCEARDAIASAVPYYLTPCWFTLDPASLLVTSHHDHGMIGQLPPEWLAHEYYEDDFHKLAGVACSERGPRPCTRRQAAIRAAAAPGASMFSRTEATRSCSSPCARRQT